MGKVGEGCPVGCGVAGPWCDRPCSPHSWVAAAGHCRAEPQASRQTERPVPEACAWGALSSGLETEALLTLQREAPL